MTEHYTHDNWQAWFEQLSAPFSLLVCGEDLKYEEEFKYLKSSFSGVGKLDCKNIFITGTQLTAEKSKDLRIASYVLFASASEYGVQGLTYGFKLLNHLIEQFLTEVHPQKGKARQGVHTWLLIQQPRIIALAENAGIFDSKQIIALQEQVVLYSERGVQKLDDNAGPLTDLLTWVDKLSKKYPSKAAKTNKPSSTTEQDETTEQKNTVVQASNQDSTSNQAVGVVTVDSEATYSETLRKLLHYDKDQNNLGRLIALSRAARWADMQIPPNEQGKTRLPAPRSTAFAPIKNALANENYNEAVLIGEALFMEGAMHFNLDLQLMQLNALKGLGKSALVKQLELSLFQLISRFPPLVNLTYDDGSSFCSAKCKELLSELTASYRPTQQAKGQVNEIFDEAEQKAKGLVEKGKLEQALNLLKQLPANTAYQRANGQLTKARMCLLAERYDFAEPILQELVKAIDAHQLNEWQPHLCMQVWRSAVLCFETLAADGKASLAEQSQSLKQQMILTQPEVALGWI